MNDAKPGETPGGIRTLAGRLGEVLDGALHRVDPGPKLREVGTITRVGRGVALAEGLPGVRSEELVRLPGGRLAMAYNLDEDEVGLILFEGGETLSAGAEVHPAGTILSVPVGEALLGRIVDPLGRPLDNRGPIPTGQRRPIERRAPAIMDRAPVTVPLQTGIKAIDALIPIGRGQRELIVGDRQTGKTAIALDTIINQRGRDVISVYCVIGKESAAVARIVADLDEYDARATCIVMSATGEDPPGLQFAAPYAAMTMAEYFMHRGQDVLVVFDDMTRHARAYREMSLLLRRPPGREAFPGDIFYIHSRLLERSTHLQEELGGGTLTALPIVETEDQNIAAYIPTNLISITDGQIYLSPDLFQKGVLPAIDVGKSVSRVGGKTQLPAYRAVAGDLRLSYSQFEELEAFARFGTRLDESTRRTLERGRRVREILKQPQYRPLPVPEQIAVLNAVTAGLLDDLPTERIGATEEAIRKAVVEDLPELNERMLAGAKLEARDENALVAAARRAIEKVRG